MSKYPVCPACQQQHDAKGYTSPERVAAMFFDGHEQATGSNRVYTAGCPVTGERVVFMVSMSAGHKTVTASVQQAAV